MESETVSQSKLWVYTCLLNGASVFSMVVGMLVGRVSDPVHLLAYSAVAVAWVAAGLFGSVPVVALPRWFTVGMSILGILCAFVSLLYKNTNIVSGFASYAETSWYLVWNCIVISSSVLLAGLLGKLRDKLQGGVWLSIIQSLYVFIIFYSTPIVCYIFWSR